MKRRNDLYITEYMLQASMQTRMKRRQYNWKYLALAGAAVLALVIVLYFLLTNRF